jgi:MFS transporter, OPA family, glycerol-3-phosphate transporter
MVAASQVCDPSPESLRGRKFRRMQWRMLLVTMFCYLFFYTGRQNFGFFAKAMQEDLHLSAAAIGSISAGLLLAYGIGQSVNGGLADRFGPRNLVTLGAFLSVALNWITSFGTSYVGIIAPWAANGYAQSFGWAPSCRLTSNWWSGEERGRAFGLLLLAAGFSSVLTFALCIVVLQHFTWQWTLRLPPLALAAGGLAFWLIARNDPSEVGFSSLPDDSKQLRAEEAVEETTADRYRYVLKSRPFQLASLSIGCESIARYGLTYWVPIHFLGPNWRANPAGAAMVTLGLPIGMAMGAFLAGYLTDRFFSRNPTDLIAILLSFAAVASGLLAVAPSSEKLIGFVLLAAAGFFVYGPQASYWALCPALAGRQRAGTAVGVMNASAYGFAAVGEIAIGYMVDWTGTTTCLFYFVPAVCIAGAILALLARKSS